jgi:hypothetical protein
MGAGAGGFVLLTAGVAFSNEDVVKGTNGAGSGGASGAGAGGFVVVAAAGGAS